MKLFLLFAALSVSCFGEGPKFTVFQTTSADCVIQNSTNTCKNNSNTGPFVCQPFVAVLVETKTREDKFLIAVRYMDKYGVEMIESRYPALGGLVKFSLEDATVLLVTVTAIDTGETTAWKKPKPTAPR